MAVGSVEVPGAGAGQEQVTEMLGRQVREAVEMLISRLDQLDRDRGRELLKGVSNDDLYAGVVTVMMRVVFLLFAEERRLLPSDNDRYVCAYSVGCLAARLERQDSRGADLAASTSAWHRLLAVTRAVHYGTARENLRLPAYGGGLFDPDRYPWLEGRPGKDTLAAAARPPAVDDRTMLRMLRAVRYVQAGGERRRLTFGAMDVEQIGYVYEGLLELEVRTATEPVLGLARPTNWPQKIKADSEVPLAHVSALLGSREIRQYLADRTGWAPRKVQAALTAVSDHPERISALRRHITDSSAADDVEPFLGVLRYDELGNPAVTLPGGRYVTRSRRRAATGTHYTPRSLAREVAEGALQPLVYRPGPLETADTSAWRLRPASQILQLKVADIAMGSGAFLVAACRYLADRLIEAWLAEGDTEARQLQLKARRLITEHCLYGVDINPLAVEVAKLSLWLITMDRQRPFGFLDDRLACGDSLLGLVSVAQLETLHVDPREGRRLNHATADFARTCPSNSKAVADAITATGVMAAKRKGKQLDQAFLALLERVRENRLDDLHAVLVQRQPFHWPLAFPEVFADTPDPGFDAIIGNPPFLGGLRISGTYGDDYLAWLQRWDGNDVKGAADLAARFVLRADRLLSGQGQLGFVTTKTLVEGAPLRVGMEQVTQQRLTITSARSPHPWPTKSASLQVIEFWASRIRPSRDAACRLDGEEVPAIGPDLAPCGRVEGRPYPLRENANGAYIGSYVLGPGFILTEAEKDQLIARDQRNSEVIQPYLSGKEISREPDLSGRRWIINFRNLTLEQAAAYPDCLDIVRRLVKPLRDSNRDSQRREIWWRFTRPTSELYKAISGQDHALAIAQTSSTVMPVRIPGGQVFDQTCIVFTREEFGQLAILSSSVHWVWVMRYTTALETRLRYLPSSVFVTLPRPAPTPDLQALGRSLDETRRRLMLIRAWGLTKTYNRVHSPESHEHAIAELRDIHVAIDEAVMRAYGWDDIDLKIGTHPTKVGARWTVSKEARFELLDRLLEENHRRYALENPS